MPTLYVENVPEHLYDALRERARQNRKSISSEVLSLLEENVVTPAEQRSRQQFLREAQRLRSQRSSSKRKFSSAEELQREDRLR
ncbi:MAG: FitA-like ribbon-helix-helix domain-containing protein [Terriglobales bacterium]